MSKTVLFLSSNGAGLGHVTRLMAVARRLPSEYTKIFATMSLGMPVIKMEGFFAEFIPSKKYMDVEHLNWNSFLENRLLEIIDIYNPKVVVFDGTAPYFGLAEIISTRKSIKFIWNRRGMWKKHLGKIHLKKSYLFDLVIEPGEIASPFDSGETKRKRNKSLKVNPIIYLDEKDILSKEESQKLWEIDSNKTTVLVQLGAGNINDINTPINIFIRNLLKNPNIDLCVSESVIARTPIKLTDGIKKIRGYPLSKFYKAFDFIVSAAGYNSFHELIAFKIPSIFVPNIQTSLDNQLARAQYAHAKELAVCVTDLKDTFVRNALDKMLNEEFREKLIENCTRAFPGNGAQEVSDLIADMIEGKRF